MGRITYLVFAVTFLCASCHNQQRQGDNTSTSTPAVAQVDSTASECDNPERDLISGLFNEKIASPDDVIRLAGTGLEVEKDANPDADYPNKKDTVITVWKGESQFTFIETPDELVLMAVSLYENVVPMDAGARIGTTRKEFLKKNKLRFKMNCDTVNVMSSDEDWYVTIVFRKDTIYNLSMQTLAD